jgi:DNA-directed RNA polymerase subunit M/transcription elongation factor TFIIS
MFLEYNVSCDSCNASKVLKYGTLSSKICYEAYGCKECGNLFSVKNTAKLVCPKCKGDELVRYTPELKENIKFYESMYKQKKIPKKQFDELKAYWSKFESNKCPSCKKKKLVWKRKS